MWTRFIVLSALTTAACESKPELSYVDVGVDVQLNAVAEFGILAGSFVAGTFIAVGSGGIVVDSDGEQWDLGDIELRDVAWGHDTASYDYTLTWMVVGDQGTAAFAVAEDALNMKYLPLEWTPLELGIESDLHAVNFRPDPMQIVVAGDETLRVWPSWKFEVEEWEEPQWVEPSPPPGGWGRLRALFPGPDRLWAAGEEGRLLWSDGDLTTWTVDDPNTTVNLNGGCFWNGRAWLVGDDGFIAYFSNDSTWVRESLGTKADLLSFEYPFGVIASDRTIHMVRDGRRRELVTDWVLPFDWQPHDISPYFAVGDGGQVVFYDEGLGYI